MKQESMSSRKGAEQTVRDIRRRTRKRQSPAEKSRIVLAGLCGSGTITQSSVVDYNSPSDGKR